MVNVTSVQTKSEPVESRRVTNWGDASVQDARILLLDLNPESGLGIKLKGILESSPNLSIYLRHDSVGVFGPPLSGTYFSNIISRITPDVIFLISSPSQLERIVPLFRSMGSEPVELPIIAVSERYKPEKMYELLKTGVVDFITPPAQGN